ncbi:bifunctional tetrahydrofolate synthase/dihydrofolate synthase [Agarivorans sp. TSD2052]|uniref:bifunctional tetrahydrofolate synthase/dihydrofolate synthase n=1 Tax=Agarivorans sp. TSD2052 TaxID=2937286 RepID=UPI00200C2B0E|nr:bifunctional tetrahydrofolate synthase/dihydrofolate synthase [Agarivorans sp. TSD2052]UPW16975.1 bifunctional tetrahydrofolate synthase/dihydrofolate synthase [Agarivorans sp. TSD2052]
MPESTPAQSRSLTDWLCYLETQHHSAIDLGLERVAKVASSGQLCHSKATVITVAGTNGKGSTCALLEQILLAQGYKVGVYSSPHILDYRERVRINGQLPEEREFCRSFTAIEALREDTSLSYFEFGTLAAIWLFAEYSLDYVILEVGLGGRLDATNIVEPDVSVVTTVAIDHIDWLGDDLAHIGREKAGIFRQNGKVVIGDANIVSSVLECAQQLRCQQLAAGIDYNVECLANSWSYTSQALSYHNLPYPLLPLSNAATAIATLEQLGLDLDIASLQRAISQWQLAGRLQTLSQQPLVIADVAHNPQSADYLAKQLTLLAKGRKIVALCAMLNDKDMQQTVRPLLSLVDHWYVSGLSGPRGDDGSALAACLTSAANVVRFETVDMAYNAALSDLDEQSMLIVFGSFFTVAEAIKLSSAQA